MREAEARSLTGQIFATQLSDLGKFDLERYPISNYIIFKQDFEPTFEDSRQKISLSKSLLLEHRIEPLFMLDEEGGRVSQIEDFFAPAPSALAMGDHPLEIIGQVYASVSLCLLKLGIDINLFPCLDVMTEPLNPIIGTRSFGSTPEKVIACSRAAITASRRYVCCVGKHFPGHGMTRSDSHLEKPIVVTPRRELESIHLPPFKEAIKAGIDGMMVSHCQYVALQGDRLPASLSSEVVGKFLRGPLAFKGLIVTDSLDMKAVRSDVEPHRVGLLALKAGCDVLLFTEYSDRLVAAFESIVEALIMDRIDEESLRASIQRRKHMLERLKLIKSLPQPKLEFDYEGIVASIRDSALKVKDQAKILPIAEDEICLLTTSEAIAAELQRYIPRVVNPSTPDQVKSKPLVLWMVEPLHVPGSFKHAAAMIEQAAFSVLITSHEMLVDLLPPCDVTIICHDTSLPSMQRIPALVFAKRTSSRQTSL